MIEDRVGAAELRIGVLAVDHLDADPYVLVFGVCFYAVDGRLAAHLVERAGRVAAEVDAHQRLLDAAGVRRGRRRLRLGRGGDAGGGKRTEEFASTHDHLRADRSAAAFALHLKITCRSALSGRTPGTLKGHLYTFFRRRQDATSLPQGVHEQRAAGGDRDVLTAADRIRHRSGRDLTAD